MMTLVFFLFSCDKKADDPWKFNKPPILGNELPVTLENIIGTWNVLGLYSEQKDMTAINPALQSGYLILRSDDSCFFQMNARIGSPLLKGVFNTDSIADGLVFLEMVDGSNVAWPEVRLTINKLTDRQMDADYFYYDPGNGKGESREPIRLLADFNFNNGSLSPDYFADDISVSDINLVGITVGTAAEQTNDSTVSFTGFLSNVNNQVTKNLNFKLKPNVEENEELGIDEPSGEKEKLGIDSIYIKASRMFYPERPTGNATVQFCTSSKTLGDFAPNGIKKFDLPLDGSQMETTVPAGDMALGDSIFVGLTANILGTNGGYLFIDRLSVYGRLVLGEKYLYNYVFEKQ